VSADAIVVGAGICGAAAAHYLAERGAEVLVLDRAGIAAGTTGLGEGNVLVCDRPPGPERELALLGRELWSRLAERFPAARVTRKGALVLGAVDGVEAGWVEPALAPGVRCRHEPEELQVDPRGLVREMVAPLSVRLDAEVAAVGRDWVRLADGTRLSCGTVVVATGPWAAGLTGLPIEPRKGQLLALAAPAGLIRHKLLEASYPEAVAGGAEGCRLATVVEQTLDGDEVLVGSSRERVGFDPAVDPELGAALLRRAARFVPVLAELPVRREWVGFRAALPDPLPAVGQLDSGVWVSAGHEGSGVGIGPICGLLLARAIAGEGPGFALDRLDPRRFDTGRAIAFP
jgi:glycine/D-amino acid oxidase-like deaminating enzyme